NAAAEPRACPQWGGVSPPSSSGTPDRGPGGGARARTRPRRFAYGSAVRRQTRRIEPPGCTRFEQSNVCESGGSSAALGDIPAMRLFLLLAVAAVLVGCCTHS